MCIRDRPGEWYTSEEIDFGVYTWGRGTIMTFNARNQGTIGSYGETRDQVAMNIDWFPTIVELCGLNTDGLEIDGKSLVPLIKGGVLESPHDVLHFDFEKQWAVRYGDWKLINNAIDVLPNDKNKVIDGLYLTNLKEDPTESANLKDKYPEKVKELLKLRKQYEDTLLVEKKK